MTGLVHETTLIPSSDAKTLMDVHISKNNSDDRRAIQSCNTIKRQYSYYSFRQVQLIGTTCKSGHYFVVQVIFDATSSPIFKAVTIYDSLRITGRNNAPVSPNCAGAQFLITLQKFLSVFAFYDVPGNQQLIYDPNYILKEAKFVTCPSQVNSHDCGLFGVGTMLHILEDIPVTQYIFAQLEICRMRLYLYTVLPRDEFTFIKDPKKELSRNFILHFFDKMKEKYFHEIDFNKDEFVFYFESYTGSPGNFSFTTTTATTQRTNSDEDEDVPTGVISFKDDVVDNSLQLTMESQEDSKPPAVEEEEDKGVHDCKFEDITFKERFVTDEQPIVYTSLDDLEINIAEYERASSIRLKIVATNTKSYRRYCCNSHINCPFMAMFGAARPQLC